jgi:hypothetical protein
MKKLILSLTVMVFAVLAQAGDTKASKDAAPCCSKTGDQAKGKCPMAAKAEGACCKDAPGKQVLMSPKAAGEVAKKL